MNNSTLVSGSKSICLEIPETCTFDNAEGTTEMSKSIENCVVGETCDLSNSDCDMNDEKDITIPETCIMVDSESDSISTNNTMSKTADTCSKNDSPLANESPDVTSACNMQSTLGLYSFFYIL